MTTNAILALLNEILIWVNDNKIKGVIENISDSASDDNITIGEAVFRMKTHLEKEGLLEEQPMYLNARSSSPKMG